MIQKYFKRETSGGKFIPEIDGLRAMALSMVFFFHFNGFLAHHSIVYYQTIGTIIHSIFGNGDNGVALFFTISAFILSLPMVNRITSSGKHQVNPKKYLIRRITRLHPTYVITLVLFAAYLLVVKGISLNDLLKSFGASNLYIHNLLYQNGSFINYVLWSLEIEFQFYLLLPLLAFIFCTPVKIRRILLLLLILTAPFIRSLIAWQNHLTILDFYHYFLGGMLLADSYSTRQEWTQTRVVQTLQIGCFVAILVIFFGFRLYQFGWLSIASPLLAAGIIWMVLTNKLLSKAFTTQPLVILGTASYTGYLIHFQLISGYRLLIEAVGLSLNNSVVLVTSIIMVPVICYFTILALFIIIEHPFMRPNWYQLRKNDSA